MVQKQHCYKVVNSPAGHYLYSLKVMKGVTYTNPDKKIKTRRNRKVKHYEEVVF